MQTIIGQYRENRNISAIFNEILFETKYRAIFRDVYCFSCREISLTPVRYFVAAYEISLLQSEISFPPSEISAKNRFRSTKNSHHSTKYHCHSLWPFNLSHVEGRLQLNSVEISLEQSAIFDDYRLHYFFTIL